MAYQPTQSSDESFEEFISDGSIYDFGLEDMNDIATAAIDFLKVIVYLLIQTEIR